MGITRREIVTFDFTCDLCERTFTEDGRPTLLGAPQVIDQEMKLELVAQGTQAEIVWRHPGIRVLCPTCVAKFGEWWLTADRRPR